MYRAWNVLDSLLVLSCDEELVDLQSTWKGCDLQVEAISHILASKKKKTTGMVLRNGMSKHRSHVLSPLSRLVSKLLKISRTEKERKHAKRIIQNETC